MFTMLAARTDFSLGEAIIPAKDLPSIAQDLGQRAVAMTDSMSITGLVDFAQAAKKLDMKAIVGARLRISEDALWRPDKTAKEKKKHMPKAFFCTLYARSEVGLKALYRLLTLANDEQHFYYVSKLDWADVLAELVKLKPEDYALVLGDEESIYQHRDFDQHIVPAINANNLAVYAPIVVVNTPYFGRINKKSIDLHQQHGWPLLAIRPSLYTAGDADAQELMAAVCANAKASDGWFKSRFNRNMHPMNLTDFVAEAKLCGAHLIARGVPGAGHLMTKALQETVSFVDSFTYQWAKQPPSLPKLAADEYAEVVKECQKGFIERFKTPMFGHTPSVQERREVYLPRLNYELSVLKKLGFSPYFLNVQDIVRYAKSNGILVGPGRGSCFVKGSLVGMADGSLKPIETVEIGQEVIAHDGSIQPVIDTYHIEKPQEIVDLEFDNGVKMSCTGDHKFFTKNRGWVRADEITEEDEFDDVRHL